MSKEQPQGPAGHPTLPLWLHAKEVLERKKDASIVLISLSILTSNTEALSTSYYRFVFYVKKLWP